MGSLWTLFCGESDCPDSHSTPCGADVISLTRPSSCINHVFTICFNILLLIMFFVTIFSKKSSKSSHVTASLRNISSLQLVSAIYNSFLGLFYLCLGVWILEEKLRKARTFLPLHWWMLFMLHGFIWLLLGLTISLRGHRFPRALLRLLSILALLFVGMTCGLSVFAAILEKEIRIKTVLDVLSFVGSGVLILCTYRGYRYGDDNENDLYDPLLSSANGGNKTYNVTPFAEASFLSECTFWWLNPLMKKGKEKTLDDEDIPKLREDDRAESCYLLYTEIYNRRKQSDPSSQPSILKTILLCHWKEIVISGFFAFLKVVTISASPILLKEFIKVAEGKESFEYERYLLVLTLFFTKILESISQPQWYFRSRLIGLKVRSLLTAVVYQKQQRLSNAAKLIHSSGEIMNYITVDAYRIGEFPFWFHQIWTTSLQLYFAIFILFQALYAWETHFRHVIEKLRKIEDKWLKAVQLRRAYNLFLFWSSPMLVSAATFGACYFLGVPLSSSNVFTFVATLHLVQGPITSIPNVIGVFIQARVAFARIVKFLEAPELETASVWVKSPTDDMSHSILFKLANLSWDENPLKPTLRNINVEVKRGDKIAICGEVGSGKSTLLAAVLGEVPITQGTVQVHGTIAYVSQSAWIQTGSIRENILFGSALDKQRYQDVLDRCSLVKDLELLPYGDLTEIGERGINLSGGQKQRVQLARALYKDADIYLLDDPFSAVDAHTATNLFNVNGDILHAASYSQLLSSSQKFQNLVQAHKETIGSERLSNVTASQRGKVSSKEIHKTYAEKKIKTQGGDQLIKKEEREVGDTGFKPYILYLKQNKGFLIFSVTALCHLTFVIGQIIQNSWMAANVDDPHVNGLRLILVYLLIGVLSTLFLLTRILSTVVLGMRSSRALFSQLLISLFRAPMSFYDSTPLGRILSRVSSDLSIIDIDIPFNLVFTVVSTTNFYASLAVLAVIAWQVLFRYYFSSAKELMRINGTTKSFVANHLAESIAGVTTIRAFKEKDRFFAKNLELVDTNGSPYFHYFSARFIGMALSYGLSLNMFLVFSINDQCMSANYITSVERLDQYMHIPSEEPEVIKERSPSRNWPTEGKVEIQYLQIKYRPEAPLVLRGITCTFEGGHKIGIVGRTGSGKTTLIGALFRLVEPSRGKIVVDGIDISRIGLHDLRSRFGIIPQDPTLFNGTVRYNLDPLGQHIDKEIWEVLGKCQLKDVVQEKKEGLDSPVVEDGSNWSMGQRQLFCLGRALLRKSKILVLDEATASIDNATDMILQKTIRTEFADCTVITVAHRIPTVMDSTMVLAISDGKLVEYDEPMKLMKREDSLFGQLVKEYCRTLALLNGCLMALVGCEIIFLVRLDLGAFREVRRFEVHASRHP
ncbi:Multidrug resistance-associated protein/mitoxantrone resistance protein, ABC superfamily [Handroanthus impetiginosus]|uniref:ABC-type xenobiotic transporter n=1 Tax=Handroanthus impetiginosus TaxID=429701 RepID=A0A2G9HNF1_9LAMI|nr:Multidrug resistance-associated protein/mitoxantrone resistance protein, ABC superfamily [Handroanthus impetiginosus]